MPHLLIRHKVQDYDAWKPAFDEHGAFRRSAGSRGGLVFRNAEDPNEVLILLEWENLEGARQFTAADDLRETMQRAGVADQPDFYLLEEADRPPV